MAAKATLSLDEALRRAATALGAGDPAQAEQLCRRILNAQPQQFEAQYLLGIIAARTRRAAEAAELLSRAAAARPDNAAVQNDCGNVLRELGRPTEALEHYERALRINPDFFEARFNRGAALQDLGRRDEALESYAGAARTRPDSAEAHLALGNALHALERFAEALASYDRAIVAMPGSAEAHNNRAATLQQLHRPGEALQSCERALALAPGSAEAHHNYAGALKDLGRYEEARASYQRALALKPGYADAHTNLGIVQQKLGRLEEALASYQRALQLRPDGAWLYGSWLHAKMQLCEWSAYDSEVAELTRRVTGAQKATGPFPLLALSDSPGLQRRAAELWVRHSCPASPALPALAKRSRRGAIRVGYFSADFQDHATAHLATELFELHDRGRFEITAFSFGADDASRARRRLEAAFDRFLDVRAKSPLEIAALSRDLEIDIAVDLMGFTQNDRTAAFAHRAAPIQVNYLGYPGTMGAPFIDYIVADRTLIPEESRAHYAEKIAYLPDSYQVNDRRRQIGDERHTRAGLGLPPTGFVYCCFNSSYKITPDIFAGWMRILTAVGGSVLWLLGGNERAAANLRRRAETLGVDGARLIFAGRLPPAQHLARYGGADLFLDTFPCNAHTTASDALWAGVPVLTRMGETFAARVAASLLRAVGLPELVTTTQGEYEATAIRLAAGGSSLGDLRQRLQANRLTAPLFDSARYTRHLEEAYGQMYARYLADLPPEHLFIAG